MEGIAAYVDGDMIQPISVRNGKYQAVISIEDNFRQAEINVEAYDMDHLSPIGTHQFKRTYNVNFPVAEVIPGNMNYIGGLIQQVVSIGPVCFV